MKKKTIAILMSGLLSSYSFANSLENMQVRFLKNNDSVLKLDFEETPPELEEFRLEKDVVYLKMPKIKSKLSNDYFDIQDENIKNVKIEERGNNLHVYISTNNQEKPLLNLRNDTMTLTFKNNSLGYEEFENIVEVRPDVFVDDVSFERESDNQSKIKISHNSKKTDFESIEHDDGVTLIFNDATIPARLFKNSNVSAFKTPIKEFLTKIEDDQLIVDVIFDNDTYKTTFVVTEANNEVSLIVKGKKKTLVTGIHNKKGSDETVKVESDFNGELITFNFQDISVEHALYTIATKMGLNLVMGDNIEGTLSLKLNDVPYDQALDVILRTKGLGKYIEGNIMIVAPLEEIVEREQFELASQNKIKEIKPLENKEIQVNYAKSTDVAALLEGMKSNRGKIIVDERTNKIFIEDIDEKIVSIERFIESIDVPVRQVSVEARIVYAKKSAAEKIGVRWGSRNPDASYNQNVGDTSVAIQDGFGLGSLGGAVNTAAVTLGFMNTNVDVTLEALEESGDVEVVARPLVIAANKQQSKISSGQEIPYLEISDEGDATISFKEILLSLDVTPQITPDDNLILDLAIVQDSLAEMTEAGPALDTTNIETRVVVENLETLVLGGVFKENQIIQEEQVPLLGDLPLIGDAFKYKENSTEKVELLIFITPKILSGDDLIRR